MSIEYDKYLNEHRNNVKKGWEWIKENIPNLLCMRVNVMN